MSHLDPCRPTTLRELSDFGLLVGGAFVLVAGIAFWRHKSSVAVAILGGLGAFLILTGLVAPGVLRSIYRGWIDLAMVLSKVTTPIFMGIVYFVILTPTGLLMRAFGRQPLRRATGTTSWVARPPGERRGNLERQF